MDVVTMNAAANLAIKRLFANGVIGGEENEKITYDGNGEKIDLSGVGVTFVKMRDEPLDLTKVYKVGGYSSGTPDNPFTETGVGDFEVLEVIPGLQGIVDVSQAESENAIPGVLSVSPECEGFATGLYFLDCDFEIARMYTTYIEYTKAVSTIDPKYLTKTINIADYKDSEIEGMIALAINNGGGVMADIEVGAFWQDVDTDQPIKVKMTCGYDFETPNCNAVRNTDGTMEQFSFSASGYMNSVVMRVDVVFVKESDTKATIAVLATATAPPA